MTDSRRSAEPGRGPCRRIKGLRRMDGINGRAEASNGNAAGTGTALTVALMPLGPKLKTKVLPLPNVGKSNSSKAPAKFGACRNSRVSVSPGINPSSNTICNFPASVAVPETDLIVRAARGRCRDLDHPQAIAREIQVALDAQRSGRLPGRQRAVYFHHAPEVIEGASKKKLRKLLRRLLGGGE